MSLFVLKPCLKLLLQWRCPWLMTASPHQRGELEFLPSILLLTSPVLPGGETVTVISWPPGSRWCPLLVQGDLEPPEATHHPCSILAFFWDPLNLGYLVVCKKLLVSYYYYFILHLLAVFSNIIWPLEVINKEYTGICTGKSIFLNKFWYSYVH